MIICFDLDGTLIDTEEWILDSQIEALNKNGIKPTKKQIYNMWGLTFSNQIKKLQPGIKKSKIDKIRNDFNEIRFSNLKKLKLFKNTRRVLNILAKDYKLCLVSNNGHNELLRILKIVKLDTNLFEVIIGDTDVKRPKPFPDEIYLAEKRLNKKVNFMVGDTQQDIKTAKAAKVRSIIIKSGPKQIWKTLKDADYLVEDIKEIPKIIKNFK